MGKQFMQWREIWIEIKFPPMPTERKMCRFFLATDVQQKKIRDECSKEQTRTLIRNNVNSLARSGYASGSRQAGKR